MRRQPEPITYGIPPEDVERMRFALELISSSAEFNLENLKAIAQAALWRAEPPATKEMQVWTE